MKKKNLTIILIVFFIELIICAMYMIDKNRMKNNQHVIFSKWGYKYVVPKKEEELTSYEKEQTRISLEDLPEEYSFEKAIIDKCVVSVHGMEIYNKDELDEFIENVNQNKADFIRCINYTIEGDMIITDVEFIGNNCFNVGLDTTRDKWSHNEDRKYMYYKFSKLEIEEKNDGIRMWLKEPINSELEELYITGYDKDAKIINNSINTNQ